jgi:flagellar secretion chaperone FliS
MDGKRGYEVETERMRKEYAESRLLSAHPVEVIAMLYEIAIAGLQEAIGHLRSGDRFARSRAITRAEQAVQELLFALDHSKGAEFSRTSAGLYHYALKRMVAGHAKQSEAEFEEALRVLKPLARAWTELKTRTIFENKTGELKGSAESPVEAEAGEEREEVRNPYAAYREGSATSAREWS